MEDRKVVKLKHPIQFGEQVIEELAFRRPMAKDFRRLPMRDGQEADCVLTFASRLSGQPDAVIDQLAGEDLVEVMELIGVFFPNGPAIGGKPWDS